MRVVHSIHRNLLGALAGIVALLFCLTPFRASDTLPARLTDAEFWQLVTDYSEPDGTFISDNYVSNERSYQQVLANLAAGRKPASGYIGVGPEQNFTYILSLQPKIAFVVDIRRQNLIEHLMYKALFELSANRAEFLSKLFSRKPLDSVGENATLAVMFESLADQPPDFQLFRSNLAAIQNHLTQDHGFRLSDSDLESLQKIFQAFRDGGFDLTYSGPGRAPGTMPSFAEIMLQTDREGVNRGFLATEENFQYLRVLQRKNLLIPVVGDFAGPHALTDVGAYLKEHGATVTAFYTSNVEQYLFMYDVWRGFYSNVATLPVNSKSVFIRGLIRTPAGTFSSSPALPITSHYETGLFPIADLADAFKAGLVRSYADIVKNRQ
jgi:hypothetical protein